MIIRIKADYKKCSNLFFRIGNRIRNLLFVVSSNPFKIPVIINNFNQLKNLKLLLSWLQASGYKKIYIIDNASDYIPLLDFYKKQSLKVYRLDRNMGQMALWKTHIFLKFKRNHYIYTDPDILPVKECPANFIYDFIELLKKYPGKDKVGFGLKIDDLPDHYPAKAYVIEWEKQFWKKEIEPNVFDAPIDTTFALYRKGSFGDPALMNSLRTGGILICRHLPWYLNPAELDSEDKHYINGSKIYSSWSKKLLYNYSSPLE